MKDPSLTGGVTRSQSTKSKELTSKVQRSQGSGRVNLPWKAPSTQTISSQTTKDQNVSPPASPKVTRRDDANEGPVLLSSHRTEVVPRKVLIGTAKAANTLDTVVSGSSSESGSYSQ